MLPGQHRSLEEAVLRSVIDALVSAVSIDTKLAHGRRAVGERLAEDKVRSAPERYFSQP